MQAPTLIACFAAVLAITCSAQASSPILPSEDPFYIQPENISAYKPGDVIRHRAIATTLQGYAGIDFTVKSATQFLYKTTDSLGQSVAALSTFLAPNGNNTSSSKLLAFSFAYDSANNDCSPSYALQKGANGSVGSDVVLVSISIEPLFAFLTDDTNSSGVVQWLACRNIRLRRPASSISGWRTDGSRGPRFYSGFSQQESYVHHRAQPSCAICNVRILWRLHSLRMGC